jgi:hypothetical protein
MPPSAKVAHMRNSGSFRYAVSMVSWVKSRALRVADHSQAEPINPRLLGQKQAVHSLNDLVIDNGFTIHGR